MCRRQVGAADWEWLCCKWRRGKRWRWGGRQAEALAYFCRTARSSVAETELKTENKEQKELRLTPTPHLDGKCWKIVNLVNVTQVP